MKLTNKEEKAMFGNYHLRFNGKKEVLPTDSLSKFTLLLGNDNMAIFKYIHK